ncbi:MAG TPA: AzlC family ABC transporter permease [Actinomycetota bacterium]|nr:AzlC family ABC transporter permease [Actinomycetota bacterium]
MTPEGDQARASEPRLAVALAPIAAAIFVFGAVYGTVGARVMGSPMTLLSSAIVFSGALQFTVAGLLLAGAGAPALLAAAVTLNVRHVLLGAVLRSRIHSSPLKRAGAAWFLLDETVGLALTREGDAARILWRAGPVCYVAWLGGTAVGLVGGSVDALQSGAEAVFPVLFIGLAALSCRNRSGAVRAVAAAVVTGVIALVWTDVRSLAPVLAALVVAIPGGDS